MCHPGSRSVVLFLQDIRLSGMTDRATIPPMSRVLITIPAWNEAQIIEQTLAQVVEVARGRLGEHDVLIEVADNGSTDGTATLARAFAERERSVPVSVLELTEKGKGIAVRRSWERHVGDRDVLLFTDADLAADLSVLPAMVGRLQAGGVDFLCGSRFVEGSKVEREARRELTSRIYRGLQHLLLKLPVEDAQCGLKGMTARTASLILPQSQETGWLFDSEWIGIAAKKRLNVAEIPVSWVEQRDENRRSSLNLARDGWGFLLGLARIRQHIRSLG